MGKVFGARHRGWNNARIEYVVRIYERLLDQGKIEKDGYAHKRMKKIRSMRIGG
jgi:hypothetical protein